MPDLTPTAPAPPDPAEKFYSGAMDRIRRFMAVIGVIATIAVWIAFGWKVAVGLALGCMIAWVNFYWLKQAVGALADRVTATGRGQSSSGVVARFLLRYALIALAGYAIFRVSRDSLYGLLGGLFLTVAAILCEAVYEVVVALRRGL
ncbi:MAG: ATP synthase subunit I [Acidobacteriia bacterium]|nr:ATP synthase subunit I [Terriglobia bacterium]